jgi:hypothetical protein
MRRGIVNASDAGVALALERGEQGDRVGLLLAGAAQPARKHLLGARAPPGAVAAPGLAQ